MNAREWIDSFAAELGADPPSAEEIKRLLDVAGVAAHSSERIAAPITCWIAGRAGASLEEVEAAAARLSGSSEASDST
jgi:hypothetical protein